LFSLESTSEWYGGKSKKTPVEEHDREYRHQRRIDSRVASVTEL
jgi:hypothetical protein